MRSPGAKLESAREDASPIHPVNRSRSRDSRMTSPSGLQSREISPPSWPVTVARVRVAPKPSRSGGPAMAGPPRSVHVRTRVRPCSAPTISTCPFGVESAPNLAEFVPNSCRRSAKLEIAGPEIPRSGPAIVIRSRRAILNVLVRRDDRPNERMQRRWLCALRIVSAAVRQCQRMRPSESR